uniref:Uncharacterized protein n=1 Tax=Anopheles dirus TaxID=7168 RepID=A0A182NWY7_9DIPT
MAAALVREARKREVSALSQRRRKKKRQQQQQQLLPYLHSAEEGSLSSNYNKERDKEIRTDKEKS